MQVVDKSTIEVGSADDIRNKLSSFVKDKYFICKYQNQDISRYLLKCTSHILISIISASPGTVSR